MILFHWRSDTLSLCLSTWRFNEKKYRYSFGLQLQGSISKRVVIMTSRNSERTLSGGRSDDERDKGRSDVFTTIPHDTAFLFCYSSYWRLLMLIIVAVPPVPSTTWSNHWPYPVGYRPYIVCGVLDNCQSSPIVSPPNSRCESSSSHGDYFDYFWHRMILPLCQ